MMVGSTEFTYALCMSAVLLLVFKNMFYYGVVERYRNISQRRSGRGGNSW
jgi:hypothetical protein